MKASPSQCMPRALRWFALATALLAGCGGGDQIAGPGVGGTGSYASGPISGFGSVIVNGIRFDDSQAQVYDDDGALRPRSELALGMTVEVKGSTPVDDAGGRRSSASEIRYGAELKGAVQAVDPAGGTLQVWGITVKVKSTTVFSGTAGLAGLAVGNVVEVHGLRDDSGAVVATRIEFEAATVAAFAADPAHVFRLTSRVTSVAGNGFAVAAGAGTVSIVSVDPLPAGLAVGSTVRLRLRPLDAGGVFTADRIVVRSQGLPEGLAEAEIEGFVDSFGSAASFTVAGTPVSTSAATTYRNGTAADLRLGARIEAEGSVQQGVLVATRIEFKVLDDNDDGNDDHGTGEDAPFELHGAITAPDAALQTFGLRGQTVRYDAQTQFEEGTAANLLEGAQVEVRAVLDADGTRLLATRIKIGD